MFKFVHIRDGHDNFFTPVRLLFAVIVMIGHCFYVTHGHLYEKSPLAEPAVFFGYRPSLLAVNLFFIVSGFLVTKSVMYRGAGAEFVSARVLRILPALVVHVLFVMFVMGPFVTTLPLKAFVLHPDFLSQPLKVLSFYRTEMVLPGALTHNTEQVGSATLWTLRYEVMAYMGTGLLFCLGLMKHRWMILVQFLGLVALWPLVHVTGVYEQVPGTFQNVLRLGLCYAMGATIYAYRDKLSFHILGIPIVGCIAAAFHNTIMFEVMVDFCLAYMVFWLVYVKMPKLNGLQKIDDVSYGIYIYHYCILQWIYYINPQVSTLQLLVFASPFTLALALASWHFVEKPLLAKKQSFGEFLKFSKSTKEKVRAISL
ncbi:MAG: acyltransferase family protein [Maricaulaceae bacterium]